MTPLQERLLLLVHLRRQRIKYAEMEIHAISGLNDKNGDALKGMLDDYRRMLFPGAEKPKDDFLEGAKKALAAEATKVYMVQSGAQAGKDAIKRAMNSADPDIQRWAARELQQQEIAKQRLNKRLSRGKKE